MCLNMHSGEIPHVWYVAFPIRLGFLPHMSLPISASKPFHLYHLAGPHSVHQSPPLCAQRSWSLFSQELEQIRNNVNPYGGQLPSYLAMLGMDLCHYWVGLSCEFSWQLFTKMIFLRTCWSHMILVMRFQLPSHELENCLPHLFKSSLILDVLSLCGVVYKQIWALQAWRENFLRVSNFVCLRRDSIMAGNDLPVLTKFPLLPTASQEILQGFLLLIWGLEAGFRRLSDDPEERVGVRTSSACEGSMNFFPSSQEVSQGTSALWRGYLPIYKEPCALMSTVHWATVTGCKTVVSRGNHNWWRNTALTGNGGDCSQLDGMCLLWKCMQKLFSDTDCVGSVLHKSRDLQACLSCLAEIITQECNKNNWKVLWISVASQCYSPQGHYCIGRKEWGSIAQGCGSCDPGSIPVNWGGNILQCSPCLLSLREDWPLEGVRRQMMESIQGCQTFSKNNGTYRSFFILSQFLKLY